MNRFFVILALLALTTPTLHAADNSSANLIGKSTGKLIGNEVVANVSGDADALDSDNVLLGGSEDVVATPPVVPAAPAPEQVSEVKKGAVLEKAHAALQEKVQAREDERAEEAESRSHSEITKWNKEEEKYKKLRLAAEEATMKAKERQSTANELAAQAKQAAQKAREDFEKQSVARDDAQEQADHAKAEAETNNDEMMAEQAKLATLKKSKQAQNATKASASHKSGFKTADDSTRKIASGGSGMATRTLTRDCNVRAKPSTSGAMVGPQLKGSSIQAKSTAGSKWSKVRTTEGDQGFMAEYCFN